LRRPVLTAIGVPLLALAILKIREKNRIISATERPISTKFGAVMRLGPVTLGGADELGGSSIV